MKKKIFVTSSPSFYKNKLFEELAKRIEIFVFFTGGNVAERNDDFYKGSLSFNHTFLPSSFLGQKRVIINYFREHDFDEIIYGGWDTKIAWWMIFNFPKDKNSCIFESSVFDSEIRGVKALLKRLFLSRISKAYPSGILQTELLKKIGYKGIISPYGGCGILNYLPNPPFIYKDTIRNFLFVGRLVEVKNLRLLIKVFNQLPNLHLTIIGFGVLEKELKSLAASNVEFTGPIDNEKLPSFYKSSDVFILPSIKEPWGLVVEEALNNGLPVIVSDRVGCSADLVKESTGLIFHYNSEMDLLHSIEKMLVPEYYNGLRKEICKLDFGKRAIQQIETLCN